MKAIIEIAKLAMSVLFGLFVFFVLVAAGCPEQWANEFFSTLAGVGCLILSHLN